MRKNIVLYHTTNSVKIKQKNADENKSQGPHPLSLCIPYFREITALNSQELIMNDMPAYDILKSQRRSSPYKTKQSGSVP